MPFVRMRKFLLVCWEFLLWKGIKFRQIFFIFWMRCISLFFNMVIYINQFPNVKPVLHSWEKPFLAMIHYYFYSLLLRVFATKFMRTIVLFYFLVLFFHSFGIRSILVLQNKKSSFFLCFLEIICVGLALFLP